jgi:hypothetical protein
VDGAVEPLDLHVVVVDEVTQDSQSVVEGIGEFERVELGSSSLVPHVLPHRQDPVPGHHRVSLGLDPGAQSRQLVAEPDQLSELSRRRSDPRLGQPS